MEKALISRRMFTRFLSVFCIFLAALLAISLPILSAGSRRVERQNLQLYQETIEHSQDHIDTQLGALFFQLEYFSISSSSFQKLCRRDMPLDYLLLGDTRKQLERLLLGYPYIRDVFLVTRADLILGRTQAVPNRLGLTDNFFKSTLVLDGVDSLDSLRALEGSARVLGASGKAYGSYEALMFTLPLHRSEDLYTLGQAYVLVDLQELLSDMAPPSFLREGAISISCKGEEIWRSGPEEIPHAAQFHAACSRLGLTFTFTVPGSLPRAGVQGILSTLWGLLATAFLGGLALTLFFALRTLHPMYRIAQSVQAIDPSLQARDEYEYVSKALERLSLTVRESREQLESQRSLLSQNMLERALLDGLDSSRARQDFHSLLPGFPARYQVVLLEIPLPDQANARMDVALSQRLLIDRLLSEQFDGPLYHLSITPNLIALILPEEAGGVPAMERFHGAFCEACQLPLNVFVGLPFEGAEVLAEAYASARQVQQMASAYIETRVWHSGNFPNRNAARGMDYSLLQSLYEAVSAGEREAAARCMSRLRMALTEETGAQPSARAYRRTLLHSILIRVKQEHFDELSHIQLLPPDLDQPLESYLNAIDGYVATLCSLREAASRQPVAFSAEIVRYVDANFTRPELYLKSVTEHFNLSEKALQLAVRDATGMSFAEYLETRRLEMACRLLLQTELSVAEVAEQSGFALYNTFYKSFKRHFDCSPNEYRQAGTENAR